MEKLPSPRFMGLLFLLCVLLVGADTVFLQYRFAGYDLSPLIDAGWRVFSGQVPNRDFICTFPPILYLAVDVAFHLFGVRWFSIIVAGGVFSLLLTIAGLRVLHQLRPQTDDTSVRWLALVYSGLQMMLLLAVGFPWHSTWTQAAADAGGDGVDPTAADFVIRGGATLIVDLRDGGIRYAVRKRIDDDDRLQQQRDYLSGAAASDLRALYFGAAAARSAAEPFAMLHRS